MLPVLLYPGALSQALWIQHGSSPAEARLTPSGASWSEVPLPEAPPRKARPTPKRPASAAATAGKAQSSNNRAEDIAAHKQKR